MPDRTEAFFNSDNPLVALLAVALTIFAAYGVHFIIFRILNAIDKKTGSDHIRIVIDKLKWPALFLLIILFLIILVPLLNINEAFLDDINHFTALLIIGAITWLLIRAVGAIRVLMLKRFDITAENNLQARKVHTQLRVLERILVTIIVIVGVSSALMTFEKIQQVGYSLLASAGVAGIIIGFAAQKSIASMLAGFQIAITQPIRIEDVVSVEGEFGNVEEITLTYVAIRLWDKRRLIVPITYFIEKPFVNYSRVSSDILAAVYFYTYYRVPVEEMRKELTRLLKGNKYWDGQVNVVEVTNTTDRAVEIRALMSCHDSSDSWNLQVYVREKMLEFLQKNYPDSLPHEKVDFRGLPRTDKKVEEAKDAEHAEGKGDNTERK